MTARRDRRKHEPLQRGVVLPEVAIRNEAVADPVSRAKIFDLVPIERMQPAEGEAARRGGDDDQHAGEASPRHD